MDVVLPEPDNTDSSETRWALETARTLWGQGERREALQWVRRAAEAASESGHDDRALLLAKQGAELRGALDIPLSVPPPAVAAGGATGAGAGSSPSLNHIVPPGIPRPAAVPAVEGTSAAPVAAAATARSVAPAITGAPPAVAPASVAPSSSGPARPSSLFPPPSESNEVVVTVVQSDGLVPSADASLVSRRAVRVAVIAVDTPNELRVRKLAPGEVAPKDSTVALLVAFEPGVAPVPEGG